MKFYNKPIFWLLFFAGIHVFLIFFSPLLPFVDLPNHLAEATIYRYYHSPGNLFSDYYELVPWFYPNQFHLWFCALPVFPSVELGNKFFYGLYILLLPVSIYLIVKELKGNLWFSLFSLLFLYGYNVTYGFSGYTIAIPTIFFLFYFMLLDFRMNQWYFKIIHGLLMIALFTMHAQVALFGMLIYGTCSLYKFKKSFFKILVSLVPTLPVLILIASWLALKESAYNVETTTGEYLFNYYSSTFFSNLGDRLQLAFYENYQLQEGAEGKILGIIFSFLIVLPVLIRYKTVLKNIRRNYLNDRRIYVGFLLLISAGCFFVLPEELPGQTPISQRFGVFVWLSCVLFFSLFLGEFKEFIYKGYLVAIIIIYSSFWGQYIIDFNEINRDFNRAFFKEVNDNALMSGIIDDYQYRGKSTYIHFPNYFIVWNLGISTTKIIDYRFGIIRRKASKEQLPEYYEWGWQTKTEEFPYETIDYLLVKKGDEDNAPSNNIFSLFKQEEAWELYRNNNSTF